MARTFMSPESRARREEDLRHMRLRAGNNRGRPPLAAKGAQASSVVMKRSRIVKDRVDCPECGKEFLERGLAPHMRIHKSEKETEAMFTVDIIALMDRITKLEEANNTLQALLNAKEKELYERIDGVEQMVFDQVPQLKDGSLLIESADADGNTVYGRIKPEEIIQAEAEQ